MAVASPNHHILGKHTIAAYANRLPFSGRQMRLSMNQSIIPNFDAGSIILYPEFDGLQNTSFPQLDRAIIAIDEDAASI
jgi:hypothetical protein